MQNQLSSGNTGGGEGNMPKKKRLTAAERRELLGKNKKILKRILKYKTNIIGLDIGTNTTGFYSDPTKGLAISGKNNPNRYFRMQIILNNFENILNRINKTDWNSSIAILEDYSLNLRSSSIMQIAELTGALKLKLLASNIQYVKVAPITLKKYVLGPSRGTQLGNNSAKKTNQKQFILLEAFSRWGQKFSDDNVCDAFCLYMFLKDLGKYLIDEKSQFKKWEIEMFDKFITDRGLPQTPLKGTPSEESIWP